ncbi:MAG TPA: SLOG family protein [Patescibacteria group bacterium]|nr:SLOG family protein [Patescibacteria group bacterium]
MYTMCFTGHRQLQDQYYNGNANGTGIWANVYRALYAQILFACEKRAVTTFIAGGAIGVDTVAAQAVLALKVVHPEVKLIIARPFPSQASKWSRSTQELAAAINKHAEIVDVSPDPYSPHKMQIRNQWMIDNSQCVLAVQQPDKPAGGTANAVQYAKIKQKLIGILDPFTLNVSWSKG